MCSVNPLIVLEPKQYHINHICETKWNKCGGRNLNANHVFTYYSNHPATSGKSSGKPELRWTMSRPALHNRKLKSHSPQYPPDTPTKSMMIKNIMALLEFKQLVGSTKKWPARSANHFHLIHGPQQQKQTRNAQTNKKNETYNISWPSMHLNDASKPLMPTVCTVENIEVPTLFPVATGAGLHSPVLIAFLSFNYVSKTTKCFGWTFLQTGNCVHGHCPFAVVACLPPQPTDAIPWCSPAYCNTTGAQMHNVGAAVVWEILEEDIWTK